MHCVQLFLIARIIEKTSRHTKKRVNISKAIYRNLAQVLKTAISNPIHPISH